MSPRPSCHAISPLLGFPPSLLARADEVINSAARSNRANIGLFFTHPTHARKSTAWLGWEDSNSGIRARAIEMS
jgi:hypothetical protein